MPSGSYRRFSSRHHLLGIVVAAIPFRPRSSSMNRPAHELGGEVSFWVSAGVAQRLSSACPPPPPPRNCADTSPASLNPRHVLLVDDDAPTRSRVGASSSTSSTWRGLRLAGEVSAQFRGGGGGGQADDSRRATPAETQKLT